MYFSKVIKMWPYNKVLNWHTSNWLRFDIYVDSMGLNTIVNSLIFEYTECTQSIENELSTFSDILSKITENETAFEIAALGFQGLCDNGIFYNNS